MSAPITETGESISLESREHRTAPVPFTRNLNNDTTNPVISDVRIDGGHIAGMVKESTVWDVYNNEARKVDNELVKDWTASLNFLLVFTAIFAAVLTAFIIESKKMLEPDQTEILVDLALQYLNGIGSQSRTNLTRPDFEPTFEAISINCLLFASLGASLVAALASVVALQWVADYDAAITRGGSSPEERAKRRHFRHAGVVSWKMGEIIAALPILLYSSVVLFWVGAIQWMWTLHRTVGYVVAGGTAIAVFFYASTTILAAVHVSAPFRTPLSRALYWAMNPSASTIRQLISRFPIKTILRRAAVPVRVTLFLSLFRDSVVVRWVKKHFLPERTSRYREDQAAEEDPTVASDALAWLAQQLPISADSHERLLLCVSGIPGLSTEKPPSPRFHDAPWLTILDLLSTRFMTQILNPMSSNQDYRGIDILVQCIRSPFIRDKVVPAVSYMRDPGQFEYWTQGCVGVDRIPNSVSEARTSTAFLLARDVPVPSLGSKYELEATWKLIRWRASIGTNWLIHELRDDPVWLEVFSDIRRYSSEFLESCLCHFRTWTNAAHYFSSISYAVVFDSIVEQALHRELTTGEALALFRAFASYLTAPWLYRFTETVDETNIIPQPLSYALAVGQSPESIRAIHLGMTLLIARAAKLLIGRKESQWVRWVILMLWIGIPKEPGYFEALEYSYNWIKPKIRNENEMSWTEELVQGPHVDEIGRILWPVDDDERMSLSRDVFDDAHRLRYLELLLQWAPDCHPNRTCSHHILLHLYQVAENPSWKIYASFLTGPIHLESLNWTRRHFNPILALLALSDSQDLSCLRFGEVDIECARRILEIIKAVKRQPVALLCPLTDILNANDRDLPLIKLAVMLVSVRQAIALTDEESTTSFLRPLASSVESRRGLMVHLNRYGEDADIVSAEAQSISGLLHAKYAASFISSIAQMRLLSCARSSTVAQPALGRLRVHVPL